MPRIIGPEDPGAGRAVGELPAEIPLNPPLSKGDGPDFPPLKKGGEGGFEAPGVSRLFPVDASRLTRNHLLVRSMAQPSRITAVQEPESFPENVVRAADLVERELVADFGAYPEDHPAARYIKEIFDGLLSNAEKGKYKLILTPGWESVNAYALPNGTVIVSDRLLTFVEQAEELQFVLRHELTHIRKKHGESIPQAFPRTKSEAYQAILQRVSRDRLQEYEADLRAFAEEEGAQVNAYGGILFVERLVEMEAREKGNGFGSNLVHGSAMDRLINLHYAVRLVDLSALSRDLTPVPKGILQSLKPRATLSRELLEYPFSEKHSRKGQSPGVVEWRRKEALQRADLLVLGCTAPKIYKRWQWRTDPKREGITFSHQFKTAAYREFVDDFVQKYRSETDRLLRTHQIPACDRAFYRGLLAAWHACLPLEEALDEKTPLKVYGDFFEAFEAPEDFARLPRLIRGLAPFDLPLWESPVPLLQMLVNLSADAGTFEDEAGNFSLKSFCDYCEELAESVVAVFSQIGLIAPIDKKEAYSRLIPFAVLNVRGEEIPRVVDELAADSKTVPHEFYTTLFLRVGLPEKRLIQLRTAALKGAATDRAVKERLVLLEIAEDILTLEETITDTDDDDDTRDAKEIRRQQVEAIIRKVDSIGYTRPEEMIAGFARLTRKDLPEEKAKKVSSLLFVEGFLVTELFSSDRPYIPGGSSPVDRLILILQFAHHVVARSDDLAGFSGFYSKEWWTKLNLILSPRELIEFDQRLSNLEEIVPGITPWPLDRQEREFAQWYSRLFFESMVERLKKTGRRPFFNDLKGILPARPPFNAHTTAHYNLFSLHLFDHYQFDMGNPAEFDEFVTAVSFIADLDVASQMVEGAMAKRWGLLSNDELKGLLFDDPRTRFLSLGGLRSRFVEEKLRTPPSLRDAIHQIVTADIPRSASFHQKTGVVILANEALQEFFKEPVHLLHLALSTAKSDKELKRQMLAAYSISADSISADVDHIDDFPPHVVGIDEDINRLYSLDDGTKHALLRGILVGSNGILLNEKARVRLIGDFFADEVEEGKSEEERNLSRVLQAGLTALAKSADPISLYFILEPILFERFFRRPLEITPWEEVLEDERLCNDLGDLNAEEKEELLKALTGKMDEKDIFQLDFEDAGVDNGTKPRASLYSKIAPYLPEKEEKGKGKISPIELLLSSAGQLGAPGVRILQIIGQYMEIGEELEREFSKVYDSVPGQSKLSAFYTLRREWPALDEELLDLGKTIGGGSLAIVNAAQTKNGKEAVKTLNPNPEFHLDALCDILEKSARSLLDVYPLQAPMALLAVEDIREWLRGDITYEGFLEKDRQFRADHHGFSMPGFRYKIHVPQSYGPDSQRIKREEFIEGTNLTDLTRLEKEELREITALLAHGLLRQIQHGLLHSNFHPGNIRITPNREIAILDRNFYLELNPDDQILIASLMTGDMSGRLQGFADYLAKQAGNPSAEKISFILEEAISSLPTGVDPAQGILHLLLAVRRRNVRVPLKITLMVMNALALNKLAKKAGFKSLKEAYDYTPSKPPPPSRGGGQGEGEGDRVDGAGNGEEDYEPGGVDRLEREADLPPMVIASPASRDEAILLGNDSLDRRVVPTYVGTPRDDAITQEALLDEPIEAHFGDAEKVQEWSAVEDRSVTSDQGQVTYEAPDHLAYAGLDGYSNSSGLLPSAYSPFILSPTLATPTLARSAVVFARI